MNLFGDMANVITEGEPLGRHTYFGLGGRARWFARPRDASQFSELVKRANEVSEDVRVLGLGANLLVSDDGVDGVVVRLNAPAFRQADWPESESAGQDELLVRAGGGADMNRLALDAVRLGWAGLEVMAGIPGTLGGIIRMNAGGRYGQIADVVEQVTLINGEGEFVTLSKEQIGFTYRHTEMDGYVCEAVLRLRREDPVPLRQRFMEIWNYKKKSQPLAGSSAGCIFKNPPNGSAGQLIDQAGLKGRAVGGAHVSEVHANFIVVKEGAMARDVLNLVGIIRREVAEQFGVELDMEVEVWDQRRARRATPA